MELNWTGFSGEKKGFLLFWETDTRKVKIRSWRNWISIISIPRNTSPPGGLRQGACEGVFFGVEILINKSFLKPRRSWRSFSCWFHSIIPGERKWRALNSPVPDFFQWNLLGPHFFPSGCNELSNGKQKFFLTCRNKLSNPSPVWAAFRVKTLNQIQSNSNWTTSRTSSYLFPLLLTPPSPGKGEGSS